MIFESFRGHREFPTRPPECLRRCERRSADGLDQQTFIRTSADQSQTNTSDKCLTSLQKNIRDLDFGGAEKSIIYLTRCTHFLNLLGKFCLKLNFFFYFGVTAGRGCRVARQVQTSSDKFRQVQTSSDKFGQVRPSSAKFSQSVPPRFLFESVKLGLGPGLGSVPQMVSLKRYEINFQNCRIPVSFSSRRPISLLLYTTNTHTRSSPSRRAEPKGLVYEIHESAEIRYRYSPIEHMLDAMCYPDGLHDANFSRKFELHAITGMRL